MSPDFERRLSSWLADLGVQGEGRRLVRATEREILVSKVPEGFAARLHQTLDELAGELTVDGIRARYRPLAEDRPGEARVNLWQEAVLAVLEGAMRDETIAPEAAAEVRVGVESVTTLLDSVLWSGPTAGADFAPGAGEVAAYRDVLDRMSAENSLFTRFYGLFDGKPVVNHCPGVATARQLLAAGWEICTGTPVPATSAR